MTYINRSDDEEKTYVLRFDPRWEQNAQWRLLQPEETSLSKKEKKRLKDLQKQSLPDDALVYDRLKIDLSAAELQSEDAERAIFSAPVDNDEMPEKMKSALTMTVTVNKPEQFVEVIALQSNEPFKPAAIRQDQLLLSTPTI